MGRSPGRAAQAPSAALVRGLSPSRLEQLHRDLALTPEERVLAAEATLRIDRLRRPNVPHRVLSFESYEEYLDYKFRVSTGGE